MQILLGPRQVGKTTLLLQIEEALLPKTKVIYASADATQLLNHLWIEQEWNKARTEAKQHGECVLCLDEIQKIDHWSEHVKRLWDQDTKTKTNVKVILSGSSAMGLILGTSESLAGHFELNYATHWSFLEIRTLYPNTHLKDFILLGAYPKSYELQKDIQRWREYLKNSIIESVLNKDILQLTRIDKPALLRKLFELGSLYSRQILSYQKMLEQLQDVGNTTTLAHYLKLLSGAYLLAGLEKFDNSARRKRSSSPKLLILNNALTLALSGKNPEQIESDEFGHYVESAVGSHLYSYCLNKGFELYYWREGNFEVDFVVKIENQIYAIEVKSGRKKGSLSGLKKFKEKHPKAKTLVIDYLDQSLEEFFTNSQWMA